MFECNMKYAIKNYNFNFVGDTRWYLDFQTFISKLKPYDFGIEAAWMSQITQPSNTVRGSVSKANSRKYRKYTKGRGAVFKKLNQA